LADKYRTTFPIAVEFTDGEIPSSSKMNGLAAQAKYGQSLMEYALGDMWNQSGDSLLNAVSIINNSLMIPNLSRYIGAPRNISPRIPYLPNITEYTYNFTADANNYEATLTFPPHDVTPAYNWAAGTGTPDPTPETSLSDVNATGEWYIDENTGHCVFYDQIVNDWRLEYKPIVEGDINTTVTSNVIPDIDTDAGYDFKGLKICYVDGLTDAQGYYIFLPPRMPLSSSRRLNRSPQTDAENLSTTPTADRKFFMDDGEIAPIAADYGEHYRYRLPKLITDTSGNGTDDWTASSTIPRGLVYLWDPNNTGTIIEGVVFAAENAVSPRPYVMIASGDNLTSWLGSSYNTVYEDTQLKNTPDPATHTHTADHYPNAGLRLITVGSDLSTTVSELVKKMMDHDHASSSSIPTSMVSHGKTINLFTPDTNSAAHPAIEPSTWDADDHPQYLHRLGCGNAPGTYRDDYYNSLLGEFLMSSTNSGTNYRNLLANSNKISFGLPDASNGISQYLDTDGASEIFMRFDIPATGGADSHGIRLYSREHLHYLDLDMRSNAVTIRPNEGDLTLQGKSLLYAVSTNGPAYLVAGNGECGIAADGDTLGVGHNVNIASDDGDVIIDSDKGNVTITADNGEASFESETIRLQSREETTIDSSASYVEITSAAYARLEAVTTATVESSTGDVNITADDDVTITAGDSLIIDTTDIVRTNYVYKTIMVAPTWYPYPGPALHQWDYDTTATPGQFRWEHQGTFSAGEILYGIINDLPDSCDLIDSGGNPANITFDIDIAATSTVGWQLDKITIGGTAYTLGDGILSSTTGRETETTALDSVAEINNFYRSNNALQLSIWKASGAAVVYVYPHITLEVAYKTIDPYNE